MRTRTAGAVAGIAAAGVALGAAELVAIATGPESSPLVAVGGVVVDYSPEPVVEFGISVFGIYDKVALLVGTLVLLAGLVAGLGPAALRRPWVGVAGVAVLAGVGAAAAVSRHGATAAAVLPTLVGVAAGGGLFFGLRRIWLGRPPDPEPPPWAVRPAAATPAPDEPAPDSAGPPRSDPPDRSAPPASDTQPPGSDRRRFVRVAAVAVGGAVAAGLGGRWLSNQVGVSAAREEVALPAPAAPAAPVPAGADLALPDLASYVTRNRDFYRIDTALVPPRVDPDTWVLSIHGRVRFPYQIDFAELLSRPMVERHITLACVSNEVGGELIGNARWLGVPVAELLAAAEPLPGADQVVSRSVDGWTCGTPTEVLADGRDALLAVGMNGAPLPLEHGFPVRMVVPGLYGYVSACKWITEIELTSFDDFDAYWVPRGWAPQAPIKTQSRIDTPRQRASAGPVTVAGVAWAQHRGIERVEVRVDNGPWQEATLADTVSVDTWRQWYWRWDATPGSHELAVRATDTTGETQPEQRSPVAPDGATGWHTVRIEV